MDKTDQSAGSKSTTDTRGRPGHIDSVEGGYVPPPPPKKDERGYVPPPPPPDKTGGTEKK
jgi:hypothetical protein